MKNEKSSGLIILRYEDGKRLYLLLHYEAGHWDFVKGNIEDDEDELDTARRELKEETGIVEVKLFPSFKKKIKYFYKRDNALIRKEVIFFAGYTTENEVKLSFEHIGCAWVDYNEAMKILTYKTAREVLELAEEYVKHLYSSNTGEAITPMRPGPA